MEDAIAALLTHRSIEEAAKAAGIVTQTLMRWMKLPEFESQYRKARRMVFRQSTARLQQASGAAAITLAKVMVDPATPPAVKVRAAECILNHGLKALVCRDYTKENPPRHVSKRSRIDKSDPRVHPDL